MAITSFGVTGSLSTSSTALKAASGSKVHVVGLNFHNTSSTTTRTITINVDDSSTDVVTKIFDLEPLADREFTWPGAGCVIEDGGDLSAKQDTGTDVTFHISGTEG